MLKQYLRTMIHSKTTIGVTLSLFIYALIPAFHVDLLSSTAWETTPSFFNANYASFFFIYGATFFTVPFFFIFLQPNRTFFERDCVVVRFGNSRRYWKFRMLITALESVLYVLFLYLLIFLRAVYFGQSAGFFNGILFLLEAAVSQISVFFLLAMIFCFFSYLTHHTVLAFAFAYFFVASDYTVRQTGLGMELFALRAIAITPDSIQSYVSCLLPVLLLDLLFYAFSFIFVENGDQLQRKVT